jgi:glutaredoxin
MTVTRRSHGVPLARSGCHLCEEAKAAINASGCEREFILKEVNIDDDPLLREQYCYEIPVIFINGVKVFKHRVDPSEFKRTLRRQADNR